MGLGEGGGSINCSGGVRPTFYVDEFNFERPLVAQKDRFYQIINLKSAFKVKTIAFLKDFNISFHYEKLLSAEAVLKVLFIENIEPQFKYFGKFLSSYFCCCN